MKQRQRFLFRIALFQLLCSWVPVLASSSPCDFCPGGEISEPNKPVNVPGHYHLDTCAGVEELLPSILGDNDPECKAFRSFSTYCGCPRTDSSCSLCPDGSRVVFPEKEVPWLGDNILGPYKTCEMVESFAATLSGSDGSCLALQEASHYCGCEPIEDHCTFCPGETLQEGYYDVEMPFLNDEVLGIKGTCELFYETQYQIPMSDPGCRERTFVAVNCGCQGGSIPIFGISNPSQRNAVLWIPRAFGMLSLIASLCIMYDIMRGTKTRESVYHQLMAAVAISDIFLSIVMIIGPATMDTMNHKYGVPWKIDGAGGNDASCKATTFLTHLAISGIFWNVSLTLYFYMVVVRGLREVQLRKLRPWFFGLPLLLGLGLSFAAIPFSAVTSFGCHVKTDADDYLWALLLFIAIPALSSTLIILVLLLAIYLKVRGQYKRSRRWLLLFPSISPEKQSTNMISGLKLPVATSLKRRSSSISTSSQHSQLERRVFWQCLCYAIIFGVTWPVGAWAEIEGAIYGSPGRMPLAFWGVAILLVSLQGFNNALVYFRHRIAKRLCRCKLLVRRRRNTKPLGELQSDSLSCPSSGMILACKPSWLRKSASENPNKLEEDRLGSIAENNKGSSSSSSMASIGIDGGRDPSNHDSEQSVRGAAAQTGILRSTDEVIPSLCLASAGSPEPEEDHAVASACTTHSDGDGDDGDGDDDPVFQLVHLSHNNDDSGDKHFPTCETEEEI